MAKRTSTTEPVCESSAPPATTGAPAGNGQGPDTQANNLLIAAKGFPLISEGQADTGQEQARRLAAALAPLGVAALGRLAANMDNTVADETCRKASVDLLKFHNGESLSAASAPTLPYYSNDDLARHALDNGGPTE